jgi:hypothetical protein
MGTMILFSTFIIAAMMWWGFNKFLDKMIGKS